MFLCLGILKCINTLMFGFPRNLREMMKHTPFGIKSSTHCEDPQFINSDFLYNEDTKLYVISSACLRSIKFVVRYFSSIIIDIFYSLLMSFNLLFCTLQFPFIPVLSEPFFPNSSYLSSMFCYLKAFHTNQTFTNPIHQASRHVHFMHLMLALKPEEAYATKELKFSKVFCFRSAFLVSISFSKGCQPCTACCTGIKNKTSLNPCVVLSVVFWHI